MTLTALLRVVPLNIHKYFILFLLFFYVLSAHVLAEPPIFKTGAVFRECPECPEMVVIPAGEFLMGMSTNEIQENKEEEPLLSRLLFSYAKATLPQHPVTIKQSLAVARYPITRGEFAVFADETGFYTNVPCWIVGGRAGLSLSRLASWKHPGFEQTDREPAVCVNWQAAQAYIEWLNKKVNLGKSDNKNGPYRLPSEAEWEYAARAGTKTVRWWGDTIGVNNAACVGCGSPWDNIKTAPVGFFRHNQFGLYDMPGNIWQWTSDCWNRNYTQSPDDGSPLIIGTCTERVMRGGSWLSDFWNVTSASRSKNPGQKNDNQIGFRIIRTLEK